MSAARSLRRHSLAAHCAKVTPAISGSLPRTRPGPRGFTLIELLVTIAIAAVLMVVAVPNMIGFQRNAELTSSANTLLAAVNAARGEAMKRGMPAYVVPAANGKAWQAGWLVFVDKDRNQRFDADKDLLVLEQAALPAYFETQATGSATAAEPYFLFDGSGYPKTKTGGFGGGSLTLARTDVAAAERTNQSRRLVVGTTGRMRICKPVDAATCN